MVVSFLLLSSFSLQSLEKERGCCVILADFLVINAMTTTIYSYISHPLNVCSTKTSIDSSAYKIPLGLSLNFLLSCKIPSLHHQM